jgi:hypothetical protein
MPGVQIGGSPSLMRTLPSFRHPNPWVASGIFAAIFAWALVIGGCVLVSRIIS